MTSDQVLLDEAAAPDASAATTKPKTVRRRTTKKTEVAAETTAALAEQPTLPELSAEAISAPEPAPEKPKRTRTRTVKAKATGEAPPSETLESSESTSSPAPEAVVVSNETPVNETQAPTHDETPVGETPASETSAPAHDEASAPVITSQEAAPEPEVAPVRPSVPARFPSRFKRTPPPSVEAAPVAETEVAATPVLEPQPTLLSEAAIETREVTETQAPELTPSAEGSEDNSSNFSSEDQATNNQDGGVGAPSQGENDGQGGAQNGEFNGQNGEFPEGGFGRMRYRERREFRRQQRMQQRQERFGPGGEALPPLPQQGQQGPPNGFNGRQEGFNGRPNQGPNGFQPQPRRREYDYFALRGLTYEELENAAREYSVDMEVEREHEGLVLAVMEAQARVQNSVLKTGILDAHDHNKAFLRCEGYVPSESDVYVSQTQIKRFNLKTGDLVFGTARAPKENERFFGLLRVESINGLPPEELRNRKDFEKMTPIFPDSRYHLETEQSNITARIIDLVSPIGKGQRGLIVAPPKAGKTTLLKNIANSITKNNPEAELFVLLIDERPEEVTDISRSVRGEVVASTFDEMPENHMRVADIVLERAKRLVEMKHDVVILLDSITRLSRASNLVVTPSGRTLSGGLDPAAMYRPKRMFGAARNIEEGGSLTILATALVDTGSRMDEMIFEEFKGTGNMDLVLDRDLFNQRIFPAIDINKTGTRRDDLLLSKDELAATFHLRQTLARLDNDQAVKLLIDRLKNTKSNGDFMAVVAKSARQAEIKAAS
ncbi:transcription termination factor Rho [Abditibacteriota bacterium]|nr:transcription termination factor Rho [Abditibacteriota bacterium]